MADTRGLGALQMAVAHRHNLSLKPKSLAKDNPDETLEDKLSRMHKGPPPSKQNSQRLVFKRYMESKYFSEFQMKRAAEIYAIEDSIMNMQLFSLALAAVTIFLAMAEQELSWNQWWDALPSDAAINSFPNEYVRDDIKQTNTVVMFFLLLTILMRYILYFRMRITKADIIARGLPLTGIGYKWNNLNRWPNSSAHSLLHYDSCIWHPRPFTFILELLVCAVHPITNFHRIFYIDLQPFPEGIFRLESALIVVMFLRTYLLGIYLRDRHATSFREHKQKYDACSRPINTWFIVRSLSNQNPALFVLVFYFLEHILFTYVWRLAVIGVARKESPVHIYYLNNWWLLQFSITTVGYGDMTPQGTFGRVIFIPTVFGAVFLDSLMTGTLVNVMGLTNTEDAVLQQSMENMENSMLRNAAAGYMSAWIRWWLKADGPAYEKYALARHRFGIAKRCLLKRKNKEFHDPDAAVVTQLMRWPFDDALDMVAFRIQLFLQWRQGVSRTKVGMLSAIELRLQDIDAQLESLETFLKMRKSLHACNIQLALQRLLGGDDSLATAAALVREVGAIEMRDERAVHRDSEAGENSAVMSESDQGDFQPFSPSTYVSASDLHARKQQLLLPVDVMQTSPHLPQQKRGSKHKRRVPAVRPGGAASGGAPVFC